MTAEITRISDQDADAALTKALRGRQGRLTKADAVAVSGLPAYSVDDSLDRLLKRFRSRLEVTEDGELLYSFDPSLRRRGEPTLGDKLRALGRTLVRAGGKHHTTVISAVSRRWGTSCARWVARWSAPACGCSRRGSR